MPVLFLGLCSEAKGLFIATEAVLQANTQLASRGESRAFSLHVVGPFDSRDTAQRFARLQEQHPSTITREDFVSPEERNRCFAESALVVMPTFYAAEAFPLVALEALSHDRPLLASRWRGLCEIVSSEVGGLVEGRSPAAWAAALIEFRDKLPPAGVCRARFEENYTSSRHLSLLRDALTKLRDG